jgi:hypothetical protein
MMAPHIHGKEPMKYFSTTNVAHTKQVKEASAHRQQGLEPIGVILKRITIKEGGEG